MDYYLLSSDTLLFIVLEVWNLRWSCFIHCQDAIHLSTMMYDILFARPFIIRVQGNPGEGPNECNSQNVATFFYKEINIGWRPNEHSRKVPCRWI